MVEDREIVVEDDAVVGEFLLQALGVGYGEGHAVDSDGLAGLEVLHEPVVDVDGVGSVEGHHREACVGELTGGLDEESGVGPDECVRLGDYGNAVRAVLAPETGEPFAAPPVGGG